MSDMNCRGACRVRGRSWPGVTSVWTWSSMKLADWSRCTVTRTTRARWLPT